MSRHARTVSLRGIRRLLRAEPPDQAELVSLAARRPRTRADCLGGERPCPWASCRHHLAYDVTRAGGLTDNFPGTDVLDLAETCSLDVADRGGSTLEQVGLAMNVTRERTRQVEQAALAKLRASVAA